MDRAGERVASSPPNPKRLDQLRQALRARHYSRRTEQTYCRWVRRHIFFHNVRHPAEMGEAEINAFLTHLAVKEKVSASTHDGLYSRLEPWRKGGEEPGGHPLTGGGAARYRETL